jgi:cysteine desulfurase / selenocysteine lyase
MLTDSTRLRDFPALAEMTYLNTAAESIPPRSVDTAIADYCRDKGMGMKGRDGHFARVESCREISARMLGLQTHELSFCSCSSEAYNLLATALQLSPVDEVVITDLDFPAGATPWLRAANPPVSRLWQSRDGALDLTDLLPLLNTKTRLVQLSLVSFYNGHRLAWPSTVEAVRRLAPQAVIAVDVTQALGRVSFDCRDADIIISSTHKWTLGIHGGCVVGIPEASADRLTTRAGGWFHLQNAFDADRFSRAISKRGAASFSVGMPNFVSLYALDAALRYLESVGLEAIVDHADRLTGQLYSGLVSLGLRPMCAWEKTNASGIIAIQSTDANRIQAALQAANIHAMHQVGRIRFAVHGYNTDSDIARVMAVLGKLA